MPTPILPRPLAAVDRVLGLLLRVFAIGCLVALTALLAANIVGRYSGLFSFEWFDEVTATLFAWFVFIGAAALWRERQHFAIGLVADALGDGTANRLLAVVIESIGLAFALTLAVYGISFVGRVSASTPVLDLPQAWAYSCLPIAGVLMSLYATRDLLQSVLTLVRGAPLPGASIPDQETP